MADGTWQDGGESVARIDGSDERQVLDWAGRLGVTPEELREAIRQAGDDANAVREYLYRHHWSPGK